MAATQDTAEHDTAPYQYRSRDITSIMDMYDIHVLAGCWSEKGRILIAFGKMRSGNGPLLRMKLQNNA